jgi:RHS repeat-associated protein
MSEYFLTDALASVRQLTDTAGEIILAKNYEPYGSVTQTSGESQTSYGFTGEYTDVTGNVYLRARYYNPLDGRFLSRDTWSGDVNNPLSLNRWMYVEGNPVNYVDPSGYITEKQAGDAEKIVRELRIYNVFVEVDWGMAYRTISMQHGVVLSDCIWKAGEWELKELVELRRGVIDLSRAMKGLNKFIFNLGYVNVYKENLDVLARGGANVLRVTNANHELSSWTVVHELAHGWDDRYKWKLSEGLETFTRGYTDPYKRAFDCDSNNRKPGCNDAHYFYADKPAKSSDINFTRVEDFAESVAAYVYPDVAERDVRKYLGSDLEKYLYYDKYNTTLRWVYIDTVINLSVHWQQQR